MRIELAAEADAELDEATAWYLRRGLEHGPDYAWELAARFLGEVDRAMALVRDHPTLHAEVEQGVRRVVLRGFPYSLIYRAEPSGALVLAVMHNKRRPGYWKGRGR